jgi:outer membrane lipopolysaccharide assembly protein LptE/RlpB
MSIERTLFLSPFMALTLLLTGCGFHLRGQVDIASELRTLAEKIAQQSLTHLFLIFMN